MNQFSNLRTYPPLTGKHAFYVYLSLSKKPPSEVRPFDAGFKDQKIAGGVIPYSIQSYKKHKAFYVLI